MVCGTSDGDSSDETEDSDNAQLSELATTKPM